MCVGGKIGPVPVNRILDPGGFFLKDDPPVDHSAEIARAAEEDRQKRVTAGREAVDQKFSAFNPDYFNDFQGKYLDYYTPQVDKQSAAARKALTLRLAGSGNLTSSYGADEFRQFSEMDKQRRDELVNQAISATNDRRSKTDQTKAELYNLATSAADPLMASAAAGTRAASLDQPQTFSPLGNVFADAINLGSTAIAAERRGQYGTGTGLFRPSRSAGSGYVVT
jgi:hypothetical protein